MLREADDKNTEYHNEFDERTEVREGLGQSTVRVV